MKASWTKFVCWVHGHTWAKSKPLGNACHEVICKRCLRKYFIHEEYSLEIEVTEESKLRILSSIDAKKYADDIKTLPLLTRIKRRISK